MGTKEKFLSIKTKIQLCDFLKISEREINYVLYVKNKSNYKRFYIKKKNGENREIYSPFRQLKYIQRVLLEVFKEIYEPQKNVFGFINGKSIVDNAKKHIRKKCILNIDLKDFFPTITFYRIKGLLQKKPFNFSPEIALLIGNLVTYNNMLPQGAPTSPILSNMICRTLDIEMNKYAYKFDAIYSRYADDITISFPDATRIYYFIENEKTKKINDNLLKIIINNGFNINHSKTRLSYNISHQEVTGLTVNKKVNINKNFYYRLRSRIYAWEKFGLKNAYKDYCDKNSIKFNPENSNRFKIKVIGMLNFFSMVVSKSDLRYVKLASKVNELCKNNILQINYSADDLYENGVFLVGDHIDLDDNTNFGTAFRINKYYVTCKHCIFDEEKNKDKDEVEKHSKDKFIYLFNTQDKRGQFVKIAYVSEKYDLVFLENKSLNGTPFFNLYESNIVPGLEVNIFGFPDYEIADSKSRIRCNVTNNRQLRDENAPLWVVDGPIQVGLSGGPVIENATNKLIGIICYGSKEKEDGKINNGFLDVRYIKEELKKIK